MSLRLAGGDGLPTRIDVNVAVMWRQEIVVPKCKLRFCSSFLLTTHLHKPLTVPRDCVSHEMSGRQGIQSSEALSTRSVTKGVKSARQNQEEKSNLSAAGRRLVLV
jgi:hypothetical protein